MRHQYSALMAVGIAISTLSLNAHAQEYLKLSVNVVNRDNQYALREQCIADLERRYQTSDWSRIGPRYRRCEFWLVRRDHFLLVTETLTRQATRDREALLGMIDALSAEIETLHAELDSMKKAVQIDH